MAKRAEQKPKSSAPIAAQGDAGAGEATAEQTLANPTVADLAFDDSDEDDVPTVVQASGALKVDLSSALLARLRSQAEEDGLSLEDYVRELLAESVTLRAFEIIEKRFQMRGGNPSPAPMNRNSNQGHGQQGNNGRHNNNNNGGRRPDRGNNRRGNMSQQRYQTIMDDKATFLEYVRSQERQQR